jgi:manganese oxidase
MHACTALLLTSLIAPLGAGLPHPPASAPEPERVVANDNRTPAGTLRDGRLDLALEIRNARWFPEAEDGPSVVMPAFAEPGHAAEIPGPLIRVPEGTAIHITIHNTFSDSELVVHGLHSRPGATDEALRVPAGATREVTFAAGAPGTYFYWASKGSKAWLERMGRDAQLSGAIIVEPRGRVARSDRVFVISLWRDERDSTGHLREDPREMVVVNGKSWPYTERFTFTQGDTVSWRWINASNAPHPMHMHGFYFNVDRRGQEGADTVLGPLSITQVNTQLLTVGSTMAIHFVPLRPGNWLFHCHLAVHVDGKSVLQNVVNVRTLAEMDSDVEHTNHGVHEMAGLIIGMHVLPRGPAPPASQLEPERIRLFVQSSPRRYGPNPAIGFAMQEGAEPGKDSVSVPGPTLILERGRPARITVINKLRVETAVHWHGMEIESFPDGVPGWSGMPERIFPAIQPGDSFVAEFTPPRAGTFIYHSHVNELVQSNSGMYGPLIVTDSAHRFDPRIDRIVIVGGAGPGSVERRSTGMVNGSVTPKLEMQAGVTYRLRLIQIHPQAVVLFRLGTDSTTARWTPVAKDGADLPAEQSTARAAVVLMGAGETGDFLFTPARPGPLKLNVETRAVGWHVPVLISVLPRR